MIQLEVRPEFRDKIPPLSADEYSRLEANILEDGEVREPIVVWGNIIIDGHNRWAIIQKHPELQDKFKIKQMEFPDKWAAIVWMCRNQLGRRNLTDEQKTYLIGKQCEAQSQTIPNPKGINQYSEVGCQNDAQPKGPGKTAEIISRMNGVPKRTVQRAVQFSKGLDAAEKVSPGIKDAVLAGEVKAPKSVIARIRHLPEEKQKETAEAIKCGEIETAKSYIRPIPKQEALESERPKYDVIDFKADLDAAVDTFEFAIRQHIYIVHGDMLETKGGQEVAESVLLRAKYIIKEFFKHIDQIKLGGGTKDGKTN